jgi:phosphoglycolate phosphatase
MADLKIHNETIEDVDLVIFDKDGTLMDLYEYWSKMITFRVDISQKKFGFDDIHRKDIMYAMGVDVENKRLRSEGPVGLKKREIVMLAMERALENIGFINTHEVCCGIFREADEMSFSHLSEIIKPVNGMHSLISSLHEKGCKVAVATTDRSGRAILAMKHLGISDKIDMVVGEDMVDKCKPAPDMVELIIKETAGRKENTVMVGDALTDVEMGFNAGLKASIGVCSGLTSRDDLLRKTKYVIEDVSEIKTL